MPIAFPRYCDHENFTMGSERDSCQCRPEYENDSVGVTKYRAKENSTRACSEVEAIDRVDQFSVGRVSRRVSLDAAGTAYMYSLNSRISVPHSTVAFRDPATASVSVRSFVSSNSCARRDVGSVTRTRSVNYIRLTRCL